MRKIVLIAIGILISGCGYRLVPEEFIPQPGWIQGIRPDMLGGTAWGDGAFDSNGERIYFTGFNNKGERIRYTGGPEAGMMMGGYLACASCHGPDGRGGEHIMHMQVMDASDIRWSSLLSEEEEHHNDSDEHHDDYDLESFTKAVLEGEHPDGEPLSVDMPRWEISEKDLQDLAEYLKSLP